MIISRTPFRISFVGGGTDLRSFYSVEEGQVLSTTIDKYLYVAVKRQMGIVEHKFRINWSQVELCNDVEEIQHPIVREALKLLKIDFPIEISTFSDVPASTGLGSSSCFAVGLLHALFALLGQMVTKGTLASLAAKIEVDILGRTMGAQDHYAASYGDFNVFTFHTDGRVSGEAVFYNPQVKAQLEKNLMLFYTGLKRDASEVLGVQKKNTPDKMDVLRQMKNLVGPLREVISSGKNPHRFGKLLHEAWTLKRSIAHVISSSKIDGYYEKARKAGAVGGKLLGAGGGGFFLFYVEPQNQEAVRQSLSDLYEMPFAFDANGTRITYYDQSVF
ncbi:MAG: GHMP kinase [Candidatus Saganbacteria bacterium]|nr:GHMP kinase [Candidatus Saganbacteria bacterium]